MLDHDAEAVSRRMAESMRLAMNVMDVDYQGQWDYETEGALEHFTWALERMCALVQGLELLESGKLTGEAERALRERCNGWMARYGEVPAEIKAAKPKFQRRQIHAVDNSELGQRRRARAKVMHQLG